MLAAVMAGPRSATRTIPCADGPEGAYDPRAEVDFLDAKGLWEAWLGEMRVDGPEWRAYAADGWKSGASAEVAVGASRIAWAGRLAQDLLRSWEIEASVHVFVALLEPFAAGRLRGDPRSRAGPFPARIGVFAENETHRFNASRGHGAPKRFKT